MLTFNGPFNNNLTWNRLKKRGWLRMLTSWFLCGNFDDTVDPVLFCLPNDGGALHLKASGVVPVTSQRSAVNNMVC